MSGESWAEVADVSTTWTSRASYIFDGYYEDDTYVIGDELSPESWTAASAASTTWASA